LPAKGTPWAPAVRMGDTEAEVQRAAEALGATHVVAHDDPTHRATLGAAKVQAGAAGSGAALVTWSTALRRTLRLRSDDYTDYLSRSVAFP